MLKHWDKFQYVREKVGLAKEPEIEVEVIKKKLNFVRIAKGDMIREFRYICYTFHL